MKCFTIPQYVFVQNTDSNSYFDAIWQKRIQHNWQYWETVLFLNTFAHVLHYNIISKLRIAWHNKLLVYTSCIWDKIAFYHYPSSIKYWLALNNRTAPLLHFSFSSKSISFKWTSPWPDSFTIPALFQSLIYIIRPLNASLEK